MEDNLREAQKLLRKVENDMRAKLQKEFVPEYFNKKESAIQIVRQIRSLPPKKYRDVLDLLYREALSSGRLTISGKVEVFSKVHGQALDVVWLDGKSIHESMNVHRKLEYEDKEFHVTIKVSV
jgi:hypothetical protein